MYQYDPPQHWIKERAVCVEGMGVGVCLWVCGCVAVVVDGSFGVVVFSVGVWMVHPYSIIGLHTCSAPVLVLTCAPS